VITFNDASSTVVSISYEDLIGFNDVSSWEFYTIADPGVTYTQAIYDGTSPAASAGSKALKISLGGSFPTSTSVYFQTPFSGIKIPVPATATSASVSIDIYDNSTYAKARPWTAMFNSGSGIVESNSFINYSVNQDSWQSLTGTVSWAVACDELQLQIRMYAE